MGRFGCGLIVGFRFDDFGFGFVVSVGAVVWCVFVDAVALVVVFWALVFGWFLGFGLGDGVLYIS